MLNYFRELPDYLWRLLWRMDTFCGILIGLIFFIVAVVAGLSQNLTVMVTLAIIAVSALEAGYGLYRQERAIRAERESLVTILPRLKRTLYTIEMEKDLSLDASVDWEIWANEPVWTDEIALVLSVEEIWQRFKFFTKTTVTPLVRLPPDVDPEIGVDSWHREHYQYRHLVSQDAQPLKGSARFYIENFWVSDEPRPSGPIVISKSTMKGRHRRKGLLKYSFELVLNTRSPEGIYRVPVNIDRVRGADLARNVT